MAKKQLRTYIEGTLPAPSIQKHKIEQTDLQPGKQPLSGIIYDDKTDNTIEYDCSDGDGIIGYIVYKGKPKEKEPDLSPAFSPAPEKKQITEKDKTQLAPRQFVPTPAFADVVLSVFTFGLSLLFGVPATIPTI